MIEKRSLLCDANAMCFGSSSALLSILDHVRARRIAVASGITAEILGRDAAVDELIPVDPKDPGAVEAAIAGRRFDAALVISNQTNVELYRRRRIPIFFVDILYWFGRSKAQEVWRFAEATFVEAFPGVRERLACGETPGTPELVGPLVRKLPHATPAECGADVLINIGGGRSRLIRPGLDSPYPMLVTRWIEAFSSHFPHSAIVVAGGSESVEAARAIACEPRVTFASLPQREFLAALAAASVFVTSPGLNAVHEGLALGRPMYFLPPQNATQVLQLASYEAGGLVSPGLNLLALDPSFPTRFEALDEEDLTTEVLASLRRLDAAGGRAAEVVAHLATQRKEWPSRATARQRFIASLGPPGGAAVANRIHAWWSARC